MRKPRLLKENASYHVTVRANRKEMILFCSSMRTLLLNTIKRAKRKYHFQVFNFSIMGNHFHLIIKPENGESLSRIMQWILSIFARSWNRSHLVSGHVWGERFYSKIINNFLEFIHTFDYIIENPIKAHLVKHSSEWESSGLWHFLSGNRDILGKPPPSVVLLYHVFSGNS
ncbi:transposase [Treponema sp. OttesenSCG-928-L16]|nr:transposase [Treponema sp. OttesenSCG-928-L16]